MIIRFITIKINFTVKRVTNYLAACAVFAILLLVVSVSLEVISTPIAKSIMRGTIINLCYMQGSGSTKVKINLSKFMSQYPSNKLYFVESPDRITRCDIIISDNEESLVKLYENKKLGTIDQQTIFGSSLVNDMIENVIIANFNTILSIKTSHNGTFYFGIKSYLSSSSKTIVMKDLLLLTEYMLAHVYDRY